VYGDRASLCRAGCIGELTVKPHVAWNLYLTGDGAKIEMEIGTIEFEEGKNET
jgi:hypothetical protein